MISATQTLFERAVLVAARMINQIVGWKELSPVYLKVNKDKGYLGQI
ncbi:MAG: hypothetical protein HY226_01960 [Candidatus Vogelbacteria bacterium]|nr:hypothetical protein [Candidatus Vogelbacteria bacterium]